MAAVQRQATRAGRRGVAAILDVDPELGEDLGEQATRQASERALASTLRYPTGRWPVTPDDFASAGNLGLLLIEGLLIREVTVGAYTCAELLGPGDVVQPWLRIGPDHSVATEVGWDAVEPVTVAVLDHDFSSRIAAWPEIAAAVARRLMLRTHWLAFHLAVCGLRRVDDRLLLVLWHFADRWGSVTPDGVRLNVRLTHEILASVVGARRPSVSTAVRRLVQEGRLQPRPRSRWLLLGGPPAEFQQIHEDARRPIRRSST